MQRDKSMTNAPDFHTFHQFTAEMKACSRRRYSTFCLGKNGLKLLQILSSGMMILAIINDIAW